MTVRAFVFDLDGTLADTANLPSGRRMPWQVLEPGLGAEKNWEFSSEVSELPGLLLTRGYRVAIATRAPHPYASTLCFLLLADTEYIEASCGSGVSKAATLTSLCQRWELKPHEVAYVGDLPEDALIAQIAGCDFVDAADLHDVTFTDCFPAVAPHAALRPVLTRIARYSPGTPEQRAAQAAAALLCHPSSQHRRERQTALFESLHQSMQRCIISSPVGLFQIRRDFITNTELANESGLYREYRAGLQRLFPPAYFEYPNLAGGPVTVRYYVHYSTFGEQLRLAKDYGSHGRGMGSRFHSGPNVQLYRLDLIADIMAAPLSAADELPIVPVPSSRAGAARPGEVSRRLASLVANRSGLTWCDLLRHEDDDSFSYIGDATKPREVLLLDDQLTHGTSLLKAIAVLRANGHVVNQAVVFSVKDSQISFHPVERYPDCPFEETFEEFGLECSCGRGQAG